MNLSKFNPKHWFGHEDDDGRHALQNREQGGVISPLETFHSEVDRVFNNIFRRFPLMPSCDMKKGFFKPDLDLQAKDDQYVVSVELPGVEEKDISVDLRNNTLTISGEKKCEIKDEDSKGVYRMERSYGSFQRILSLPPDVDTEKVSAKFKDGVLTIDLPRTEALNKKKISINAQ